MDKETREGVQTLGVLIGILVLIVIVVLGGSAVAATAVRIFCAIVG